MLAALRQKRQKQEERGSSGKTFEIEQSIANELAVGGMEEEKVRTWGLGDLRAGRMKLPCADMEKSPGRIWAKIMYSILDTMVLRCLDGSVDIGI